MINENEYQIVQLFQFLRLNFFVQIAMPFALAVLFLTGVLKQNLLANDDVSQYYLHTGVVLITLFLVPAALKGFAYFKKKKHDHLSSQEVVKRLRTLHIVRLEMLIFPMILGVVTYFLTGQNVGGICAVISLIIAVAFCYPSLGMLTNELNEDEQQQGDTE